MLYDQTIPPKKKKRYRVREKERKIEKKKG
jgi:hypothetical protein